MHPTGLLLHEDCHCCSDFLREGGEGRGFSWSLLSCEQAGVWCREGIKEGWLSVVPLGSKMESWLCLSLLLCCVCFRWKPVLC